MEVHHRTGSGGIRSAEKIWQPESDVMQIVEGNFLDIIHYHNQIALGFRITKFSVICLFRVMNWQEFSYELVFVV